MQHIALEGRCFVVGVNQFCRISDYPEDYPPHLENWELGEQDQVVCRGGSVIVDPFGKIIAGPLWDQEGVLYAECDLGMIAGAKVSDVINFWCDVVLIRICRWILIPSEAMRDRISCKYSGFQYLEKLLLTIPQYPQGQH